MKTFSRSVFDEVRLPEGYYFEDMICAPIIYKRCKSFSYIPESYYGYRINESGISQTASVIPKSVDQYWLVEYILDEINRLQIDLYSEILRMVIRELGAYLYNRTVGLPENIRIALFSCACDLVDRYDFSNVNFTLREKRVYKALKKKHFYHWENASKHYI